MKAINKQLGKKIRNRLYPESMALGWSLLLLSITLVACGPTNATETEGTLPSRQAEVAARGTDVMPFDLDQTTHIFTPREDGGLQQVVVKEDADAEQLELVRTHLREEAQNFRNGDFADPAQIHGHQMPGLAELRAHDGRITVRYSELPDGAQIEYITEDEQLVEAIHLWFEAQVMDHGVHAQH